MNESLVRVDDGWIYVRHSKIRRRCPSLIFVHGLGESGLCFAEAFEESGFDRVNIVVPDLLGYGRSTASESRDYSFKKQVGRLWSVVDHFQLRNLTLVGHSMGGDIATLMCAGDSDERIEHLVNIEGALTPEDRFISSQAVAAADRGEFNAWLRTDFAQRVWCEWGCKWPSCRRYYASLNFCRPEAFLASAMEIFRQAEAQLGQDETEAGLRYCSLSLGNRRIYCWGAKSLPEGTQSYLRSKHLRNKRFEDASHWVMLDQKEKFYAFLRRFVAEA